MSMKKAIVAMICTGFALSLISCAGNAAPVAVPDKDKKEAAQEKIIIPKDVKAVMEAGLATRQPTKTDIPFTISQAITMPGPQSVTYVYFLLNVKNADMGYAAPAAPDAPAVADPAVSTAPVKLQAKTDTYVQFYKVENGTPGALLKEVYIPAAFEAEPTGYNPEAMEWYSFGYPLNPGNYLMAIALTSKALMKGGVQYYEFAVADPASFTEKLDTSTIVVMKNFQQVESPETKAELHRGLLSWSVARITPNLTKTIKVGDSLDVFFFIYGVRPNEAGKFDIQVEFEVLRGDKAQIRFAPQGFPSPLVSLPLPMKQTLEVRTGEKVEVKQQDLAAGSYTLLVKIADKISSLKSEKQVEFVVE